MAKRAPLTRKEIEEMLPSEMVKMRLSEDEYRILREVNKQREIDRQDTVLRLSAESAPLLTELQSTGLVIDSIDDLVSMRSRYEKAIPILLRHLPMPYSDAIREAIARSLAVPEPAVRAAWPLLVQEYKMAHMGQGVKAKGDTRVSRLGAKDGLACALSAAVTTDTLDELIALAKDQANGSSRVLLVQPLRKSKDPRARAAIEYLAADPELAIEIGSWKKK